MMKFGLRGRLVFTYLALVILGVGGLVIRFGLFEQTQIIESAEHELELQAFVLGAAVSQPLENILEGEMSYANFEQALNRIGTDLDAQLTLLNTQGDPIYNNQGNINTIPNQFEQAEVQAALQRQEQHQIRVDPISQEEYLYTAAPISHEGEILGIIQLSNPTEPIQTQIWQSWLRLLGTAGIIILAVVFASLWLANYIVRPLKTIQAAANQIAAGDFDQKIEISTNDELRDLAHAFNHMTAQIKQLIAQQRQFVSNASHELRTPLTNIKLRAEALLNGARDDPTISVRFLRDIENEADRMHDLTSNLLSLSRLDSKQILQNPEAFDFGPFLADIVDTFTPLAENKQITLSLESPPSLPPIKANPDQMRQVFDNLLSNALKYVPAKKHVTLNAHHTPEDVIITVADTGNGIPAQDLPHIFERFYRVDKARTRTQDPGGTGLGLAIVHSIVQVHGGQINVASQADKGTTFTLQFPVTPKPS